jgi:integrase/recombinase XerD
MEGLTLTQVAGFDDLIEGFRADSKLRGMGEDSVVRYASCLSIYGDFLEKNGTDARLVDNRVLKVFLEYAVRERKLGFKTISNYFAALSSFYDYLVFEGIVKTNVILPFRKRYLRRYKVGFDTPTRKCLTVDEMSKYVNSILDPRDKAIAVLFAKTGTRRRELLNIDVEDIDWNVCSITLKPHPKRGNRVVYFDDECAIALKQWMSVREKLNPKTNALFMSYQSGGRLDRNGCWTLVVKYAKRLGFHNPDSPKLEDHFGPHCFRHFFTTMLLRNGMKREYVKKLRGDGKSDAIDIYNHIDEEDLRRAYLAYVPKLGI